MFAALQYPFTDIRRFLNVETNQLGKPAWPFANVGTDFIRSFGTVRRRLRGGIIDWPGEEIYCKGSHALKFHQPLPTFRPRANSKTCATQFSAFRRLLADGCAIARYEIGFGFREHTANDHAPLERSQDFIGLSQFVLAQEISVLLEDGRRKACAVIEADHYLAEQYLRASTRRTAGFEPEQWWVATGNPLLLIEYDNLISETFPRHVRTVDSQLLKKADIELSHLWLSFKGRTLGVWLLGYSTDHGWLDRDLLRRIRLNLFRIHAERESIRRIFGLIASKKIPIITESEGTDQLQRYLTRAIKVLSKRSFDGLPQSKILEAAYYAEDLISEGERATLINQLANIRHNIRRNVAKFTQPEQERTVYNITDAKKVIVVHQPFKRDTVNKQTLNIHSSTVGDINQVAADTIQDSFNKAAESEGSDELKENLSQLTRAVAEMLKHLPEAQQNQVASDLKILTDEAISQAPRRKWYELSAEGLIDAAKAVGDTALPVITAAKAVVGLITGS